MAEIKSAIELAMERTKNLVMDDEEKRESRKKEAENKVKAILRRYLEGMTGADGAMSEIEEVKADPALKKSLLVGLLLDEIDITGDNTRLLPLFRRAAGDLPGALMDEFETIREDFLRELEAKEGLIRERVTERLHGMGITGDGLEPNVEAWEEWDHAREESARNVAEHIKEWKGKVVKILDKGLFPSP